MNWLTVGIILLVFAGFIAVSIVLLMSERGKNETVKDDFAQAWTTIRPLLSELFIELFTIYNMKDDSYEDISDYAINYLDIMIKETDLLTEAEKGLLTKQLIKTLLEPRLRELYDKKFDLNISK